MDTDDFLCLESVGSLEINSDHNEADHELNIIEYLVQHFILKSISHLNPNFRQLGIRVLGLISLICESIAESYLSLFLQVNILILLNQFFNDLIVFFSSQRFYYTITQK